jgi:hypothetical protein
VSEYPIIAAPSDLRRLSAGAVVVGSRGEVFAMNSDGSLASMGTEEEWTVDEVVETFGPLLVVWRPEA